MLPPVHSSYKKFFGVVSLIGLTCLFIQYRIAMTRKDAMERFSSSEAGKKFRLESLSFAPKLDFGDPKDLNARARELLNSCIGADRLTYLKGKVKRE